MNRVLQFLSPEPETLWPQVLQGEEDLHQEITIRNPQNSRFCRVRVEPNLLILASTPDFKP